MYKRQAYPQTYMTMQCPLWIMAEDAATGRRLWITQEGPRFSISMRRMDEQRHNYGPTYRITCENRTKLAQVLRYQFESKNFGCVADDDQRGTAFLSLLRFPCPEHTLRSLSLIHI